MEMTTDEQPLPPSFQAVNKMPTSESHLHMASPPAAATPSSSLSFAAAGSSTQRSRANTSTDIPPRTPTNPRRQSRAESASSATGNGRARNARASPGDDGEPSDDSPGKRKKKKGQKFFCTGYGECNLSFTRSEHLARHIRYESKNLGLAFTLSPIVCFFFVCLLDA